MVQLLIECRDDEVSSDLCRAVDNWRRSIFPTARHHLPTPSGDGWVLISQRGGCIGALQNLVDQAISSPRPSVPFQVVDVISDDARLLMTIE